MSFLCSIPFWDKALDAERQAGAIISGYAATVNNPLLQSTIALCTLELISRRKLQNIERASA
ncbi:MAG: hypothetical protein V7K92_16130 [Nostoc sp.]|uniref:hypothetical protein n=1 Tax=Nostoc sp. TaxID=1180 RepID=UPI002FF403E8